MGIFATPGFTPRSVAGAIGGDAVAESVTFPSADGSDGSVPANVDDHSGPAALRGDGEKRSVSERSLVANDPLRNDSWSKGSAGTREAVTAQFGLKVSGAKVRSDIRVLAMLSLSSSNSELLVMTGGLP